MKLGIIGDVHLGASFSLGKKDYKTGINTRLVDYQNTLIQTIEAIVEKGCTHLIFTGDIFEHRTPSIKQQELFSTALSRAIELGIESVHIVVGNHDQQRITGATTVSYIKELPLPNIHVYDEMDLVTLYEDGVAKVNLIFMPYRDRKWFNAFSTSDAINQLDEQLTYHLAAIDNDAKKICVGHMTIEGSLWMLDQYSDLYNNSNEMILPAKMFMSMDFTVMGHVHTPGQVSSNPPIVYTGSMEKRGAFEDHDKQYLTIDLENTKVRSHVEPCRDIHDIKMDLSNDIHGSELMNIIKKNIAEYSGAKSMEGSIVRMLMTIASEDEKFCNIKTIEEHLYNDLKVHYVVDIKPALIFSRQARDSGITEQSSDPEAFKRYVLKQYDGSELCGEIVEAGLELIRAAGGDRI